MNIQQLPPLRELKASPFVVPAGAINKIATLLAAYILFVIYPGYVLLRYYWANDASAFDLTSLGIAFLCAVVFGLFACRTMTRYLDV